MEVLRAEIGKANETAGASHSTVLQAELRHARASAWTAPAPKPVRLDAHTHLNIPQERGGRDPFKRMMLDETDDEDNMSTARSSQNSSPPSRRSKPKKPAADDDDGDDSDDGAVSEAELLSELDDMLAATANDLIDDDEPPINLVGLDLASRQRRGREREPEPEEVVEARAFELAELSVLQLRQLVARLGGADELPEVVVEKGELVAVAAGCLGRAPLALIDEVFKEMHLNAFRPGDEDASAAWAAQLPSAAADGKPVIPPLPLGARKEAARRIELHELSSKQLRALLVKLGGGTADGSHMHAPKQVLLRLAREAMGAAPLALLDEACVELEMRAEARRAAAAAGEAPPESARSDASSAPSALTPKADGGGGGDSDGSWDGRPLSPIGLAGTAGSESARRLARHAARVEKLKSQQLAEKSRGAAAHTLYVGDPSGGGGGGPSYEDATYERISEASGAKAVAAAAAYSSLSSRSNGPRREGSRERKFSASRLAGRGRAGSSGSLAGGELGDGEVVELRLFKGLRRDDADEISLQPSAAAAPPPADPLESLPPPRLRQLLQEARRGAAGAAGRLDAAARRRRRRPPPRTDGRRRCRRRRGRRRRRARAGGSQRRRAGGGGAYGDASAPLALVDEIVAEVEAATEAAAAAAEAKVEEAAAARARARGKRPATGERKRRFSRARAATFRRSRAPADGAAGGGHERPAARAARERPPPRRRRRRRGAGGAEGSAEAGAPRPPRRRSARVRPSALERLWRIGSSTRRVERAMRPPADLEAVAEQDLEARLRAVGVS